ncbi:MAG TPA: hypothetical protein V6C91_08320 [Coleofasciculaceae cyanobacterium]
MLHRLLDVPLNFLDFDLREVAWNSILPNNAGQAPGAIAIQSVLD